MNSLILKDSSGKITDAHVLAHIHTTLKLAVGDEVKCTVLGSGLSKAKVLELEADHCQLQLGPITEGQEQWFDLVVGLSRPQTTKKMLLHLWGTSLSLFQSGFK
jgi:16S rRNA U1498 N3-methylase RsmE